ncbi:transcription repressor NadR [Alteribacter aurantiacus]|uniref:transcription repressor NadR n=1 Tax=Alteribacter aurantiacus TaxID=254410 RepID=UPI000416BA30|nr:transcription repressor NadR [Alteribacter aurantiacus]
MTKKWLGEERRSNIVTMLKESDKPITGSAFAEQMNVSRQVIVQDISLLKAKNNPILATSQGYVLVGKEDEKGVKHQRIIVSSHTPAQTKHELFLLVDHGVTVRDVIVEHPVYGDLTASIMVSNRVEAEKFIRKIELNKAAYLSELTGGVHLHTIEAPTEDLLDEAIAVLKKEGYLLEEK